MKPCTECPSPTTHRCADHHVALCGKHAVEHTYKGCWVHYFDGWTRMSAESRVQE